MSDDDDRDQPEREGGGKAIASLILGLIGIPAWCFPLIGLPIGLIGLILGITGLKSENRVMAILGIILSGNCLVASIIKAALMALSRIQG